MAGKERSNSEEVIKDVKESPTIERIIVVKDIPQIDARSAKLSDGTDASLITIEEALTEILDLVRKIAKNVG